MTRAIILSLYLACLSIGQAVAQNATYHNPIIHADYSDPDVCRKGKDYYLTASSFSCTPGLPILHSQDLVHWELINYALEKVEPEEFYNDARPGQGVWAPSIRLHKDTFYITWGDPDFGLWMVKATDPRGKWSKPVLIKEGKDAGLEDCCPLWDDDGKTYLSHAYAGSRSGLKSIIAVCEIDKAITKAETSRLVFDGHVTDPTIEGTKFYKRNGYYYIFCPAGGVATGWQTVLRSKSPWGLYERRTVMAQGNSPINGPHQGAWVTTPEGEDWFLHFQDVETVGRIIHLQPMKWVNDWPVIGIDPDGDGCGEPVIDYRVPKSKRATEYTLNYSDEFNSSSLALQWQWMANSKSTWCFPDSLNGVLRLFSAYTDTVTRVEPFNKIVNLWNTPNLLAEKINGDHFVATTKLTVHPDPRRAGERFSFVIYGEDYATLTIENTTAGLLLKQITCLKARKEGLEQVQEQVQIPNAPIYLRILFRNGEDCSFAYSTDGVNFTPIGKDFKAKPGRWIGAKLGYVAQRPVKNNDGGWMDIDWLRID